MLRAATLIVLLAVLPHLQTARAGFTMDDRGFVLMSASIRSIGGALAAFDKPFPVEQPERGLYRPLTNLSYAVDYALGGTHPFVYHVTNLMLYALSSVLVLVLARSLLDSTAAGIAGASFFAVHPVHCEAVDSVAGRSELLALVLALAALASFRRHLELAHAVPRLTRWLVASVIFYASSVLAKEGGLMTLFVIAAMLFLTRTTEPRVGHRIQTMVPFAAVALLYLPLRHLALHRFTPDAISVPPGAPRLYSAGAVFLENLRLLLWPSTLQIDFYYWKALGVQWTLSARALCGLAILLPLVGVTIALLLAPQRSTNRSIVALGLVAFFAYLLPTSHIVPIGSLIGERFLFAPSFGVSLVVAAAAAGIAASAPVVARRTSVAVFALVLVVFAHRSEARAAEWHDEVTLQRSALALVKTDPRIYTHLGRGLIERGEAEEGIAMLRQALQLDPRHVAALNDIAFVFMNRGALDEAQAMYERLLQLDPRYAPAYNSLGVIATNRGDYSRAIELYDKAIAINANYQRALDNRAGTLGALERARAFVARHQPDIDTSTDTSLLFQLAQASLIAGNAATALTCYVRLKSLGGTQRDPWLEALSSRQR